MMQPAPKKKNSGWVLFAWGLNGLGVLALLVILIFYLSQNSAQAAVEPIVGSQVPRPTRTPAPTSFYLPTVTPNPQATEIEDYSSPTPFVFTYTGSAPNLIGYSVQNRPIEAYSFGQGENKYLIVAGIHGGYEGNTVDLANELMVYISQHPEVISTGSTLYIIPDMNPDAVSRGRNVDARVNAHGVDLNRNFPTPNWTADWDHSNCWNDRPTTGGTYGGSEPETKAVMNFIGSHHFQALISYHSAALGVFPGGVPWQAASKDLARRLSAATGYPYPPVDIGCVYTGTLADWAVENGVGAAVDMELTNHRDSDFSQNLKAMKALVNFTQ